MKILKLYWFVLSVDPIQSYLRLKNWSTPVLKEGSSGKFIFAFANKTCFLNQVVVFTKVFVLKVLALKMRVKSS
jgi:hypothetical protein